MVEVVETPLKSILFWSIISCELYKLKKIFYRIKIPVMFFPSRPIFGAIYSPNIHNT